MKNKRASGLVSISLLMACSCASPGNQQSNADVFDERCRASAAASIPDSTTVVMRDRSDKTAVAAGAVTASGSIEPWAALVGPGVATSRGGVLAMSDSDTDVEMIECK